MDVERAKKQMAAARREFDFACKHPDYTCDACGPGGSHTFYACHKAAVGALTGFLLLQEQETTERFDLNRLVTLASAHDGGFEACRDVVAAFLRCGSKTPRQEVPDRRDIDEALSLTGQLLAFVEARFPPNPA